MELDFSFVKDARASSLEVSKTMYQAKLVVAVEKVEGRGCNLLVPIVVTVGRISKIEVRERRGSSSTSFLFRATTKETGGEEELNLMDNSLEIERERERETLVLSVS